MNRHVLSGARGIVLSGARLSCYQAQERAQVLGLPGGFRTVTLITYRSFGSVITEEGRSNNSERLDSERRDRVPDGTR